MSARFLRRAAVAGAALVLVIAAQSVEADDLPGDDREHLSVAFAALALDGVPPEYQYVALSLPRLLQERLVEAPERVQDRSERDAYATVLIHDAVASIEADISSRIAARDELLFDRSEDAPQRLDEIAGEIRELRERRDALLATRPGDIEIQDRVPLRFEEEQIPDRGLPDGGDPPDVDLLISGRLGYDDGYLVVRLGLYRSVTQDSLMLPSLLLRPEDVNDEVEPLAQQLARLLLGRDFASLTVESGSTDAAVFVNGALSGFGRVTLPYADPGVYDIRVTSPGYRDFETELRLDTGEQRDVGAVLERSTREPLRIVSEPAGADLYLGAEYVGQTPFTLDRPAGPRTAELRREGFQPQRFVVNTSGPSERVVTLVEVDRDPRQELIDRREGFYRSLGWFALSVPVPLMLGGVFRSEVAYILGNQAIPPEEVRQRGEYLATIQTAQAAGVVVSGGLLINSFVQLARYIQAGRYYHSD